MMNLLRPSWKCLNQIFYSPIRAPALNEIRQIFFRAISIASNQLSTSFLACRLSGFSLLEGHNPAYYAK